MSDEAAPFAREITPEKRGSYSAARILVVIAGERTEKKKTAEMGARWLAGARRRREEDDEVQLGLFSFSLFYYFFFLFLTIF